MSHHFDRNTRVYLPSSVHLVIASRAWHLIFFSIFQFFAFFIKWIWLGVVYFKRPGPEVDYFYSENDQKVTFGTVLRNCKPHAQLCFARHLKTYFKRFQLIVDSSLKRFQLIVDSFFKIFQLIVDSSLKRFQLIFDSFFKIFQLIVDSSFKRFQLIVDSSYNRFQLIVDSALKRFQLIVDSFFKIFQLIVDSTFKKFQLIVDSSYNRFQLIVDSSYNRFQLIVDSSLKRFQFVESSLESWLLPYKSPTNLLTLLPFRLSVLHEAQLGVGRPRRLPPRRQPGHGQGPGQGRRSRGRDPRGGRRGRGGRGDVHGAQPHVWPPSRGPAGHTGHHRGGMVG